jgi:DNA-binding NtrC family response regulator
MPATTLAKQAETVRADILRLEADLKALLSSVGGAIGASISTRVSEQLTALAVHVEPLLALLGSAGAPARRGPGRPRSNAAPEAPKRRGRRRGGRGRKVNLSAETIDAALKETGGNKSAAAKLLKVSQPTFYKYLGAAGATSTEKPEPKTKAKRSRSKKG